MFSKLSFIEHISEMFMMFCKKKKKCYKFNVGNAN